MSVPFAEIDCCAVHVMMAAGAHVNVASDVAPDWLNGHANKYGKLAAVAGTDRLSTRVPGETAPGIGDRLKRFHTVPQTFGGEFRGPITDVSGA